MFAGYYEYWDSRFIAAPFELGFLVLEIVVVVMMALWCMKERRVVVLGGGGRLGEERWYQLPQYRSSGVGS